MLSGCNNQPAYKDSSLSPEERAKDLLQQLTLEEKVALMMGAPEPNIKTGWLSRYARMVTSANLGAVLK